MASPQDEGPQSTPSVGGPGPDLIIPSARPLPYSNTVRKRASRAGTRSVSTLSAGQLERKRANDREAQRAIRARTKEHIEKLERRIAELTSHEGGSGSGGSSLNDQLMTALRRVKELEEENAMLRASLQQQASFAMAVPENPSNGWQEVPNIKPPVPGQHHVRPGVSAPSQYRSANPASYHQTPTPESPWQTTNPFATSVSPRHSGSHLRSPETPQDQQAQWRYGRGRAQTTPVEEFKSMSGGVNQGMDYSSYMTSSQNHAQHMSRAESQASVFHQSPHTHDQHMRHLSEQLGLSPVEVNQFSQHQQQQQQQPQAQTQPQQQHQQSQHQQTSAQQGQTQPQSQQQQPQQQHSLHAQPQAAQPLPGPPRLRTSPAEVAPPPGQSMYYAPYSR